MLCSQLQEKPKSGSGDSDVKAHVRSLNKTDSEKQNRGQTAAIDQSGVPALCASTSSLAEGRGKEGQGARVELEERSLKL